MQKKLINIILGGTFNFFYITRFFLRPKESKKNKSTSGISL